MSQCRNRVVPFFTQALILITLVACSNNMSAEDYYNRGVDHAAKNEFALAIADYNKAIELDPNYSNAYLNRGVAYGSMNEIDSAFLDFNKVIELSPDDPFGYYNRAFAYQNIGEYEQAILDYSKAIELDPNNAEEVLIRALESRAVLYESLGRTSDAIHDFEELLKIMTDADRRKLVEERLKELK